MSDFPATPPQYERADELDTKTPHAVGSRILTANDPEPAEWSVVLDKHGVSFQLYLGWRSADAYYMLWKDFAEARGPLTLLHEPRKDKTA